MKTMRGVVAAAVVAAILVPAACFARAEAAKPKAAARHTLWRVQGPQATVYLLGSVHCLQDTNYPLPAPIEDAYKQSQITVFEADLAEMTKPATQMKLLGKVMLPAGETLQSQLTPETYSLFTNHIAKVGLPSLMFEQLRPGMAAITLTLLELQKMGFDPEIGLDRHFHKKAVEDGKEIIALETVDFQIDLIAGFAKEEGEMMIKSTVNEMAEMKTLFADLMAAWQSGDTAALAKVIHKSMKDFPEIYKRMITDRNAKWVPKIRELIQGKKNAVVIVGAGHLVGEKSVIELLEKDGLKVIQQ